MSNEIKRVAARGCTKTVIETSLYELSQYKKLEKEFGVDLFILVKALKEGEKQ